MDEKIKCNNQTKNMGTFSNNTIIQDLKVTIKESKLIFPAEETKKRVLFLSNIDQVLNFDVQTVHFFPANNEYPPEIVAEKLRIALCKVLVKYDFVAGRLKLNHEIGRLEIDCNGGGVGFVVASSDYSLNDVGDMVYPNPAFAQLILHKINDLEGDDQPLCIVQITSFKCGGFSMGVSTNHVLFDGISFKTFIQNLASQSFDDKPLAVIPCNDRRLLAARSPPRVTFPHPELLKLKLPIGEEPAQTVFSGQSEDLDFKVFRLSSGDVNYLKDKAKEGGATKVSGFNVVTAHVWRCKALSCGVVEDDMEMERLSTVLYAVDIRRRVSPPLPGSYTGNAVLTAYATAKCRELKEGPLSKLVDMVSEGSNRMTDEYARSAIDWGEVYKGFPHGEFLISSWWKLGFAEVVYSWGKPIYSCPVVYHRKDIILLFPDIEDAGLTINNNNNAVNVLAALPPKEMERFQCLFHQLLP